MFNCLPCVRKGDEYAGQKDDIFTVLLCRVLGGRVQYCDERTPDPDKLTSACLEGPFDCILGDRKKLSGTYKEFVFFDTENLYPEYCSEWNNVCVAHNIGNMDAKSL